MSVALFAVSAVVWIGVVKPDSWPIVPPVAPHMVVLVAAFMLVELVIVHVESRGEAHALTFSEIPLVAGLLLFDPTTLLIARLVAAVLALGVYRRQSVPKLFFNLALFTMEVCVAAAVLRTLLPDGSPVDARAWPAVFAAVFISYLLMLAALTAAITLFSGWPGRRVTERVVGFGSLVCLANTATGLIITVSVWERTYTALLVAGIAAGLYLLYRAHMGLTERHKNLETLHDFTRALGGSLEIDDLEVAVVDGARQILRGAFGALVLPPLRDGGSAIRVLSGDRGIVREYMDEAELRADLDSLVPNGESLLYETGQPLPGWLAKVGIKDAVIVPLVTDGGTSGAVVVANRLTEVSTFVAEDLRVFQTLASHASVALENGRLVALLQQDAAEKEHLALHDPVTGLPNRIALEEQVAAAVFDARDRELSTALLLVDLETFKEANDTLGMTTGDRLLGEVRDRIDALLPANATLARFTGDQFAVLVRGVRDTEEVASLADAVHAAFEAPFTSNTLSLVLGANVGVAIYPEHAPSADLLLQRADAATYTARSAGSGIEFYAPEADPYAPRRLALAADLREALEAGEVDVYVQPKLTVADRTVVGAEALVRWTHPRLGPLTPDQFIPAAEHTGVIRYLTHYVLRQALAQCRAWRDAGLDLSISVNLSARNLFDGHLVDDIRSAIQEAGVPPSSLTLELTESTVMSESNRSLNALDELRSLGLELSVDDFGTGYSSISHLRRLPVSELKIDKSFVSSMTVNEHDAVIVRTLIELGARMGLRTVAEGVESAEALDLLKEYGCQEAQGYLFSRPLPAVQLDGWLARQKVPRLAGYDDVIPFSRDRRAVGEED